MSEKPTVLVQQVDGVQVITINRPEARNAINTSVAVAIGAALDELDAREDLTLGVITGAGRTFCAGMDLKAFLAGEIPSIPMRGFAGIVEQPSAKPLIAAVEGHALAGGFEIALACDIIVAAGDARFGLPEVTRGLIAAAGGLLRLPKRVPYTIAMEWALTGATIDAEAAHRAGLVSQLTASGGALDAAMDLARRIAANAPLSVRATKQVIVESADWSDAEAFERQRAIMDAVFGSDDAKEGARAFAEKRPPLWQGR